MKQIYLAGGCFWGLEKYLSLIPGVTETDVGYANGRTEHPTYEDVCHNDTGHAETVHVTFDPSQLSLTFLLDRFYEAIDPTSVNRQGGDIGAQYRTGIYYKDEEDEEIILGSIALLQESCDKPVAIEVCPLAQYFPAEAYHQKYLVSNPSGYCHIVRPLFEKARQSVDTSTKFRAPDRAELRKQLSNMAFEVTQNGATEPPFLNAYFDHFEKGIYVDVTTGRPLFASSRKFQSGCGWPSFSRPIDDDLIVEREDLTYGRVRTEVRSRHSDAHLGHVFDDGPAAGGGLRYCINSAALRFVPESRMTAEGYADYLSLLEE